MSFVSLEFLILLTATAVIYQLLRKTEHKHILLLLASYLFYGYWDVRFLLLLIGQTYISYKLALCIEKEEDYSGKKKFLGCGVASSLLILGFFKYFNFFAESFSRISGSNFAALNIILPVGISFYTFQAMSYLVDVYRKKIAARDSFVKVSLYIAFFPQLVAGPIVRAADFLPQLDEDKNITKDNFEWALQVFLIGLFKKTVIADRLAVNVDAVFGSPLAYDRWSLICAVIAYSIQIYCDFSGYTDMAIAVAKLFGFELCINFDLPYFSKNPSEFWKRWHISLSSWLQDYLYIPLGGNRKGRIRTYLNLLITMVLGGLWHGAAWTFVAWGAGHGIALVFHKMLGGKSKGISQRSKTMSLGVAAKMLLNFAFVSLLWVFFRAQQFGDAIGIISGIVLGNSGIHYIYVYTIIYGALLLGVHIWMYIKNEGHARYIIFDTSQFWGRVIVMMEIWLILIFAYGGNTAFVYFQF